MLFRCQRNKKGRAYGWSMDEETLPFGSVYQYGPPLIQSDAGSGVFVYGWQSDARLE